MEAFYVCQKCGRTTTLSQKEETQSNLDFIKDLPNSLSCYPEVCGGDQIRVIHKKSIPIIDIQGKNIGELSLDSIAYEILDLTGVELVIRYQADKQQVIAWLQ